jgi:hypothetical protein
MTLTSSRYSSVRGLHIHEEFIRHRVDYRKGRPELESHQFPAADERRGAEKDTVYIHTVYIQRSDGVIKLLPIIYDSRYETYSGFIAYGHRPMTTSWTGKQHRIPLEPLQYSSYANSGYSDLDHFSQSRSDIIPLSPFLSARLQSPLGGNVQVL